jgi:hypothetical protein
VFLPEGQPRAWNFKLVAECQRIKLAGLWDPMLAVATLGGRAETARSAGRGR